MKIAKRTTEPDVNELAPTASDFAPYRDEILACHCDLHMERRYAASSDATDGGVSGERHSTALRAILEALKDGTHVRRSAEEWMGFLDQQPYDGPARGYHKVSMKDFYATGMGMGVSG